MLGIDPRDLRTPVSLSYLDASTANLKVQEFCFQDFKNQTPPFNMLEIPDKCNLKGLVNEKIPWKERQRKHYPPHFPQSLAIHSSATVDWRHGVY